MKHIQKNKESTCLTELKKQKGATFDDLNRKEVGESKANLICDKSKAGFDKTNDLFVNPLNLNRIKELEYLPNGEITSNNEKIKRDLKVILNLNEEILQERRAQLYEETRKKIRQIKRSLWDKPKIKKSELQKLKTEWKQRYNNKFRPLCRVPLYLIEKELAKL